ncbi:MAG: AAA family ATPase [Thermoguttaceae bacterium]
MNNITQSIVNNHMHLAAAREAILREMNKVVVGQSDVLDEILVAIVCGGHCLLEGVPGLAKTLIVSTLAATLSLRFRRIQFTPDLMPADITGIDIIEEDRDSHSRNHRFLEGPIFANIVLADEINRTPPKTQSALLEAMQEHRVTVGQTRHSLPTPFFVLATQNPIEQEGTYPLPEAQQDRFMLKVFVRYPTFSDELEIVRRTTAQEPEPVKPVVTADDILALQQQVREVAAGDHVIRYALALVRQTRLDNDATSTSKSSSRDEIVPDFVRKYVAWGAGPRAVQSLVLGGKARALLAGRTHVTVDDIQSLALPVLRHRLVLSFLAESEGVTADTIIKRLVETTPTSDAALLHDPRFQRLIEE